MVESGLFTPGGFMSRSTSADKLALDTRRVERVYTVLARIYDDMFDWALGPGRRRAVERLEVRQGDRILEVGVGTGLSLPLYPKGCELTGIDISEAMLEQARERAAETGPIGVRLRQMDAGDLAFPDASFDKVLAPYVISVVPDPAQVMAEMARVCRPGGTVVVVNHFLSDNPVLGLLERMLTPLSRWVGFRLDLPAGQVAGTAGLVLEGEERVNLFGLWRLLRFRRPE
jgi:phosphatidylethanolamine/phosphatidyl-N-methylethanolamine N-methyltransferase